MLKKIIEVITKPKEVGKRDEKVVVDYVYLGEKKSPVVKLTPEVFANVVHKVEDLPGFIIKLLAVPEKDFKLALFHVFDLALNELVSIVSILSEVDEDYLNNYAGIDELVEYLYKMVQHNHLLEIPKYFSSIYEGKPFLGDTNDS